MAEHHAGLCSAIPRVLISVRTNLNNVTGLHFRHKLLGYSDFLCVGIPSAFCVVSARTH